MSQLYYYTDAANQSAGPASLDEIRALAAAGKIPANPNVVAVGEQTWRPISSLDATGTPLPPPPGLRGSGSLPAAATLPGELVGRGLRACGRLLSPERVTLVLERAGRYGHYSLLAGIALVLLGGIIQAAKSGSTAPVMPALLLALALPFAQFVALRFLHAGDKLIASTPGRIASTAVLDCLALAALLGACAVLLAGIVGSFAAGMIQPFIGGLFVAGLLVLLGAVALHPRLVSLEIGEGGAGEESIGLMMFFLKTPLRLVPALYALLSVAGSIGTVVGFFTRSSLREDDLLDFGHASQSLNTLQAEAYPFLLLFACILPLFVYLGFLFASLVLDMLRAVLSVPAKLDGLQKN